MNEIWQTVLKFALSFVLGGLIGFEREKRSRPAGLRTHILVAVGSTLIAMVSIQYNRLYGGDASRIAANIVTGIGFLGAGTIMKEGITVRGLTTAASIWVASGIGIACGVGFYFPAILAFAITFLSLILLRNVEWGIVGGKKGEIKKTLLVKVTDQPGQLGKISLLLGKYGINIENVKFERGEGSLSIIFNVEIPQNLNLEEVFDVLSKESGIIEVSLD
jgi:putative Mg2+ transporter-C (MgtC) family protein